VGRRSRAEREVKELSRALIEIGRRNEALEDFAALVAHELKTPLQAALSADEPSGCVRQALGLVETVLEAARAEARSSQTTAVDGCLAQAVEDLGLDGIEITAELATELPIPPEPLRLILRNLFANAAAAGARHIHVSATGSRGRWRLHVDDDGIGLGEPNSYSSGSGLGFQLCRRLAARFGGVLELTPGSVRGTRVILRLQGGTR
jgi:signal transduction histidine kinase